MFCLSFGSLQDFATVSLCLIQIFNSHCPFFELQHTSNFNITYNKCGMSFGIAVGNPVEASDCSVFKSISRKQIISYILY